MSNQDYITRQPAKKKKNNPYKKKPQNSEQKPSNPIKKKIIIITLLTLLILGIIYALWLLKTSPSTKTPTATIEIKTPEKKTTTLPKPPKERWQYVESLKNKKVEVGEYEVKQKGPYKMQCGSFRKQSQAEILKAKIAFVGIESKIQTAQGKSSVWYKVVLGPYARKRAAEQDKHKLRNNHINGCQIWLWK
ncbi:MAG: SPOR domain-containing protein [Colwellia sp.]|nr:SPOR domain-containing protein [Colwellia sp.]